MNRVEAQGTLRVFLAGKPDDVQVFDGGQMLFLPDRVEDHSPETEIWHECHLDDVTFSDGRKVHVGLKVEEFPHGALSGEQDIVTSTLQRADGSQISDVMVVGQLKYSLAANDDGGST